MLSPGVDLHGRDRTLPGRYVRCWRILRGRADCSESESSLTQSDRGGLLIEGRKVICSENAYVQEKH
jgi:hypothetical protein